MGVRSRGGGGVQRLASVQRGREAADNTVRSDIISKVQLMGGAERSRGVEFETDPPFHLKLQHGWAEEQESAACINLRSRVQRNNRDTITCTNLPKHCWSFPKRLLHGMRERWKKMIKSKPHESGADRRQYASAEWDARVMELHCGAFATFSCSSQ